MLPLKFYADHLGDSQRFLGSTLRAGSLALFLGAGVSKPLGLPDWPTLISRVATRAGLTLDASTIADAKSSRVAMDSVESSNAFPEYSKLVHDALYDGLTFTDDIVTQKLLVAIGALTMSSRRGSVRTVVTLNFDDVLEQYWSIHGYSWQLVTGLPTLLQETDVTMYHPNGYLPLIGASSDFLVFSERSFD